MADCVRGVTSNLPSCSDISTSVPCSKCVSAANDLGMRKAKLFPHFWIRVFMGSSLCLQRRYPVLFLITSPLEAVRRFDHRVCGGIAPEIQGWLFSHLILFLHVASPCLSGAFGRKMRQETRWMIAIHYVTGRRGQRCRRASTPSPYRALTCRSSARAQGGRCSSCMGATVCRTLCRS